MYKLLRSSVLIIMLILGSNTMSIADEKATTPSDDKNPPTTELPKSKI